MVLENPFGFQTFSAQGSCSKLQGIFAIEEAGGKVTDWKGTDWNNSNSFILASNGKIHEEILQKISGLQPASP